MWKMNGSGCWKPRQGERLVQVFELNQAKQGWRGINASR
jgi:hypothetical protein